MILIIFQTDLVCDVSMECRNMTSNETGVCSQYPCHICEYEIENADNCNGEGCYCCAEKGKNFN